MTPKHPLKIFAIPLIAGLFSGAPALAQDCGAADNACELGMGSYHILGPVSSEAAKGIVIHLHGGGGTGRGLLNSGLARASTARGYVFVAPNGEHPEARWTRDWSVRAGAMAFDRDDVAFLDRVLSDVRRKFDMPDAPVLLAGFSRGGSMVWDVACRKPEFADAYAPIAGAFWDDLPSSCAGPVWLFHTHGWTDRTVPLEGRSFADGAIVQGDVWASLKTMREVNGCGKRQPERSSFDGEFWLRHWTDCDAGRIDLLLHKGGHGTPAGWAVRVLDWFESHARP